MLGVFLLSVGIYQMMSKTSQKRLKERSKINNHKKRQLFLQKKVFQLFELENHHKDKLKILEDEVEQLQQDIAIKYKADHR